MEDDRTRAEFRTQELDLAREVRGLREDLTAYRVAIEARMHRRLVGTWVAAIATVLVLLVIGGAVAIDVRGDARTAEQVLTQSARQTCQEVRELSAILVAILEDSRDRRAGEPDDMYRDRMERLDRAVQLLTSDPCPSLDSLNREDPAP